MLLSVEDARYVAKLFKDYYYKFESISEYQLECLKERDILNTGRLFSDSDDIFDNFEMSPQDMNFKIHSIDTMKEKYALDQKFSSLLELTGSNHIEKSIPGRKLRWLVEETNTHKFPSHDPKRLCRDNIETHDHTVIQILQRGDLTE